MFAYFGGLIVLAIGGSIFQYKTTKSEDEEKEEEDTKGNREVIIYGRIKNWKISFILNNIWI